VTDDENGLSQLQSLYHDESPLVLFFWTGGGWPDALKALRMLADPILWSVNLLKDGPGDIELGRVKTNVITAKIAIVPSKAAIRRGDIGGMGRPNRRRWTGIVKWQWAN
jgi:hypothetical protein